MLVPNHLLPLVRAALSGQQVFHGSPVKIDGPLVPMLTTREDDDGRVIYRGESVHATPRLYISLSYLARKPRNDAISAAVNLVDQDNTLYISSSSDRDERRNAFDVLYGRGGYIYMMPFTAPFSTWAGLAPLEVASRVPVTPSARVRITRADLQTLLALLGTRVSLITDPR